LKKNIEREMGVGFDVNLRVMEKGWPAEIPLQERNWGMADFRVLDPDGDYLRITSPKY
jgi:lactoylglutathione lyase